jgi:hypothetical protein
MDVKRLSCVWRLMVSEFVERRGKIFRSRTAVGYSGACISSGCWWSVWSTSCFVTVEANSSIRVLGERFYPRNGVDILKKRNVCCSVSGILLLTVQPTGMSQSLRRLFLKLFAALDKHSLIVGGTESGSEFPLCLTFNLEPTVIRMFVTLRYVPRGFSILRRSYFLQIYSSDGGMWLTDLILSKLVENKCPCISHVKLLHHFICGS